jgi:hypothetical protein
MAGLLLKLLSFGIVRVGLEISGIAMNHAFSNSAFKFRIAINNLPLVVSLPVMQPSKETGKSLMVKFCGIKATLSKTIFRSPE